MATAGDLMLARLLKARNQEAHTYTSGGLSAGIAGGEGTASSFSWIRRNRHCLHILDLAIMGKIGEEYYYIASNLNHMHVWTILSRYNHYDNGGLAQIH